MTVEAGKPGAGRVLTGVRSWSWYLRFLRDPVGYFADARAALGVMSALGNPLPFGRGGKRYFFAVGGKINRSVLGRPDVFRPGGQVMKGPSGSAQSRLRHGIFAMYGERHREHRRTMQPPLTKLEIPGYLPRMCQIIDDSVAGWTAGATVDMYAEMRKLSNWISAHLLFGSSDFQRSVELGQTIERWLLIDADARAHLSFFDLPGSRRRRLLAQAVRLETLILTAIERSRNQPEPATDLLSIIVRASDRDPVAMTEEELVAHTAILYAASFETTANVLAWTLFCIAQHPEIAQRLYAEVSRNFADWPPSRDALEASPLLDNVLKEAMRLMPPVALTFRTALADTDIDGVPVRHGDTVLLAHYATLRDPAVFAEPDRFRPERWDTIKPDTYEYPVFSSGSRLCLGIMFAQAELKLTIARIVQRFSFSIPDGSVIDAKVQLTLRPVPGIPMQIGAPGAAFRAGRLAGNVTRMIQP